MALTESCGNPLLVVQTSCTYCDIAFRGSSACAAEGQQDRQMPARMHVLRTRDPRVMRGSNHDLVATLSSDGELSSIQVCSGSSSSSLTVQQPEKCQAAAVAKP